MLTCTVTLRHSRQVEWNLTNTFKNVQIPISKSRWITYHKNITTTFIVWNKRSGAYPIFQFLHSKIRKCPQVSCDLTSFIIPIWLIPVPQQWKITTVRHCNCLIQARYYWFYDCSCWCANRKKPCHLIWHCLFGRLLRFDTTKSAMNMVF